jgi:hypothetical protein
MILALYQTVELTRIVILNGWTLWPEMQGFFIAEIALMWLFYLLIIPVFLLFFKMRKG